MRAARRRRRRAGLRRTARARRRACRARRTPATRRRRRARPGRRRGSRTRSAPTRRRRVSRASPRARASRPRVVRRRVQVDDQLRAAGRLGEDRTVGLHASSQIDTPTRTPATSNSGRRFGRRREVALLVEHRVVRQQLLAVDAVHPPVRAHRGRVVAASPAGSREPDDRGAPAGARRDLLERLAGAGDERRAQQQILGRIAGDRQLGEHDEVGSPAASAASYASRTRRALPSRSPTTALIWAAATRTRGILPGYEAVDPTRPDVRATRP